MMMMIIIYVYLNILTGIDAHIDRMALRILSKFSILLLWFAYDQSDHL